MTDLASIEVELDAWRQTLSEAENVWLSRVSPHPKLDLASWWARTADPRMMLQVLVKYLDGYDLVYVVGRVGERWCLDFENFEQQPDSALIAGWFEALTRKAREHVNKRHLRVWSESWTTFLRRSCPDPFAVMAWGDKRSDRRYLVYRMLTDSQEAENPTRVLHRLATWDADSLCAILRDEVRIAVLLRASRSGAIKIDDTGRLAVKP